MVRLERRLTFPVIVTMRVLPQEISTNPEMLNRQRDPLGRAFFCVMISQHNPKSSELVSQQAGFTMHAGVACKSNQRKKLERRCRYITRPAIAEQRLSLASNGNVIVSLMTPYDDGTSHVVLSPMEFIERLVALVR